MRNITYSEALQSIYLGYSRACLEMLRTTSDFALKTLGGKDFCALIIISTVAGLESYLRDRLGRTLFSSDSNVIDHFIYKYIRTYNYLHPRKEDKLTKVPMGKTPTEEQKKALRDSVISLNYHQTNKLNDRYFENIFKVRIIVDGLSEKVKDIIEIRNYLVHNGGVLAKMKSNREVDVSKTSQIIDEIGDYIEVVETRFLKKGYIPVIGEPELVILGIDEIELGDYKKPGAEAPGNV